MYVYMHTSVLFHHINDAIVNCTRRNNNLQSCGNKLLHFILEHVCKGGGGGRGGGGGMYHSDPYQLTDAWLHW